MFDLKKRIERFSYARAPVQHALCCKMTLIHRRTKVSGEFSSNAFKPNWLATKYPHTKSHFHQFFCGKYQNFPWEITKKYIN